MTAGINNWSNAFSQLFLAHQLAVSHPLLMLASFQGHRKFLSDNRGCYIYNLPLFPVSAVALSQYHRFLFLHNFKTICVNTAVR